MLIAHERLWSMYTARYLVQIVWCISQSSSLILVCFEVSKKLVKLIV